MPIYPLEPFPLNPTRLGGSRLAPALVLTVEDGPPQHRGRTFRFTEHATLVVGSDPGKCNFALPGDPYFSRTHFMIEVNPPCCRLVNLGSKNGTWVNKEKVEQAADLHDGDVISGGTMKMRVHLEGAGWGPGPDETPPLAEGVNAAPAATPHLARPAGMKLYRPDPACITDYRIEAEVGSGGMGVVYRATPRDGGGFVALKTIRPSVALSPTDEGRFLREIEILWKLSHPHIVRFLASGVAAGQLWFVMEYVAGRNASHVVKTEGPLAVDRAIRWVLPLLDALTYAHDLNFVHRDVKPSNLLVGDGEGGAEVVKLADFGLARAYQASPLSGLTMTGATGGTFEFMPPEQVNDFRGAQPTADQYSTAATLYYLLTGNYVCDFGRCGTPQQKIRILLNDPPTPLEQARPGLPAGLSAAVMRGLAHRPKDRFADMQAFRKALQPFA